MLVSSAMVLLMVPGLALFYGGLVRRKNVLTTMLYSFAAMGIIGVQWVVIGYALAFGRSLGGWIGWDPSLVGLVGLPYTRDFADKAIPELVFVMFQGKFAIITPALISGAVAERMKFSAFVWFVRCGRRSCTARSRTGCGQRAGGCIEYGVLDFAGGTVVHISSGFSALVLAMLLGPRRDYRPGRSAILPHNLTLTLLGAGLLWFGWFGFNAGSAVAAEHPVAGHIAGLAFATTQTAAAAGALTWLLIEWWHQQRPTSLGPRLGHPGGPGGDHAGGRSRDPGSGARLRGPRRGRLLRRGADEAAFRRTTTRWMPSESTGWGASWARCSPACSASCRWRGSRQAAAPPSSSSRRSGPRSRSSSRRAGTFLIARVLEGDHRAADVRRTGTRRPRRHHARRARVSPRRRLLSDRHEAHHRHHPSRAARGRSAAAAGRARRRRPLPAHRGDGRGSRPAGRRSRDLPGPAPASEPGREAQADARRERWPTSRRRSAPSSAAPGPGRSATGRSSSHRSTTASASGPASAGTSAI